MFSDIRRAEAKTDSVEKGIEMGALAEMRPVVMACPEAGLALPPGALSTGIGVQPQQPLARDAVGGRNDHLPTGHSIPASIAGEFLLASEETQ
jgi:Cu/Ag efflux pump CusA